MIERIANQPGIIVAAHRGYKSDYPENTLLAFRKSLELGVDMLEFDLRLSSDKAVMVLHDATVDRTTNGSGKVGGFSLAELKQLDAGSWFDPEFAGLDIPTLAELCELLRSYPDVLLNVEIKSNHDAMEAVDLTVAILKEYGYLERCVFACFDAAVIAYLHDVYKLRTQGFPGTKMSNFVPGDAGTYSKLWAIGIEMGQLTPEIVEEYKHKGLLVWCYCPDNEAQVRHGLACGATLMTCNDPVPAMEILKQQA
ncbi:glycerophosphodiester phosphodiesterase family protein [Paenibacillus sepulcri]